MKTYSELKMTDRRAIMFGQKHVTPAELKETSEHLNRATRTQVSDHGCGRKSEQVFDCATGTLLSDCDIVT